MAAIFMAIMLLAQMGVAQHNIVHVSEHSHHAHAHDHHGHDDHDDPQNTGDNDCQICLIAKSLAFGITIDQVDLTYLVAFDRNVINRVDQIATSHLYTLYNPRAPPVFLI